MNHFRFITQTVYILFKTNIIKLKNLSQITKFNRNFYKIQVFVRNNLLLTYYFIYSCLGDRNKGWYYGENLRTGKRGWFPLAYTEQVRDTDDVDSGYQSHLFIFNKIITFRP